MGSRRRRHQKPHRAMEVYVLENEELAVDEPISNDNGRETVGSTEDVRDRSIFVMISDPDVLDCCICFEPLRVPVFQCENGHIACSTCCTNLKQKCAICLMPIGSIRCRAIENVVQSIKISCQNKKYGCQMTTSYNEKDEHEKKCIYVPCYCPHSGCDFVASSKLLSMHISLKHRASRIQFSYDHSFFVSLKSDDVAIILQEQTDGKLFILNNNAVHLGNVVNISCIGPNSSKPGYHYDILARSQGRSLKLQSFTNNIQRGTSSTLSSEFLVIPLNYFGSSESLKLEICIRYRYSATQSAGCKRP